MKSILRMFDRYRRARSVARVEAMLLKELIIFLLAKSVRDVENPELYIENLLCLFRRNACANLHDPLTRRAIDTVITQYQSSVLDCIPRGSPPSAPITNDE